MLLRVGFISTVKTDAILLAGRVDAATDNPRPLGKTVRTPAAEAVWGTYREHCEHSHRCGRGRTPPPAAVVDEVAVRGLLPGRFTRRSAPLILSPHHSGTHALEHLALSLLSRLVCSFHLRQRAPMGRADGHPWVPAPRGGDRDLEREGRYTTSTATAAGGRGVTTLPHGGGGRDCQFLPPPNVCLHLII